MTLSISSCYKERPLKVEDVKDKYNALTDDPSDTCKHAAYNFYQDFGHVLIYNPTIADYKFNFKCDNGIKIIAPDQDKETFRAGMKFLHKALIDVYDKEFLRKNLPFSVILAKVVKMASYGETKEMRSYASGSFLAIGGITKDLDKLSNEEFNKMRASFNADLWGNYMSSVRGIFKVNPNFYKVSEMVSRHIYNPNGYRLGSEDPSGINYYNYGLISYSTSKSIIEKDTDFYQIYAPDKREDLQQWIEFIFATPEDEIQRITTQYQAMELKYKILKESMLEYGFDITKIKK